MTVQRKQRERMVKRFVPRKIDILGRIDGRAPATSRLLAAEIGIPLGNVSRLLEHYWRQGLLTREPQGGGGSRGFRYVYSLSKSGKKRLDYLRSK